ncbi:MAG: glycosyltransferase family 4 protein [Candidatus Moranbacteria bacterium]|nr:glycosyltransferase family 4 protein [Candidatus Moranbacteria bacterium]
MKILVIAPTPFFADRGTHIRILEEALALEKLGHKTIIATYHIGNEIDSRVETKISVRRIRRLLFWYKKLEAGPDWQKIFLDLMLIRKAFNLARTQHPDIIHAHLHEGVAIGWVVKTALSWRKMKLVADFHGSLTKEMISHSYLKGGLLKKFFNFIEKSIDNLGDFAITSSAENTQEITKFRKDKKVETILDGANLNHYANLPDKKELRREFELPEEKIIVTYTGAMMLNKGIRYLLEAIPQVLAQNKNVFFIIAGFPAEEVLKFVQENSLQNDVRVISPLSYFEMPKILLASDIAIDPKDSSTLQASGKILQYMAAGLPVVCFDRQNNRTYLGKGGQFAKSEDAQGLVQAILSLATDTSSATEKGLLNKKSVENFSWEISAKKIQQIYML